LVPFDPVEFLAAQNRYELDREQGVSIVQKTMYQNSLVQKTAPLATIFLFSYQITAFCCSFKENPEVSGNDA
jgi:hypothetical protein